MSVGRTGYNSRESSATRSSQCIWYFSVYLWQCNGACLLVLLLLHTAVRNRPCLLTLRKGSKCPRPRPDQVSEKTSPTWSTRPTIGCGSRSTSLCGFRNLFWHLSRDGISHGSGMSRATAASPKPSCRTPWRVVDAVVGRGNVGCTTSTSGHPRPRQNCS